MPASAPNGVLQRMTLILDEALEKEIIDQAQRLGATSYLCSYCSGKPLHNTIEPLAPAGSLVRIELLVQPRAAEPLMQYLLDLQAKHYPLTVLMDSVTALP